MCVPLLLPLAAVHTEVWDFLLKLLALLMAALLMGAVAEWLRQSAIVGYLVAGTIVGPSLLGWVSDQERMLGIAELGVAMLLFVIGLEFSPRQLLALGRVPLLAGPLQVVVTLLAGAGMALSFGVDARGAFVIGALVALSSTASVLRLLSDRAEVDSPHGRTTLGILLIQDIAVIPLTLVVTALIGGGSIGAIAWQLILLLAAAAGLIAAFYVVVTFAVPPALLLPTWRRNRDLPILLAVVLALGAAWSAQRLGVSPALGAFLAGVLLAISPFSTQIRADVQPLATVLVTLFFASVGMLADLAWLIDNLAVVLTVVVIIVLGKALIVTLLTWLCGQPLRLGVATACCLAQVGEFSFVLATIAHGKGPGGPLLSDAAFRTLISATIVTLVLTPYLVAMAPRLGLAFQDLPLRRPRAAGAWTRAEGESLEALGASPSSSSSANLTFSPQLAPVPREADRLIIIGFGPAGQRVAEEILSRETVGHPVCRMIIVDLNPENLEIARRYGLVAQLGDATQTHILEHAGIHEARAVVVTVPTTSIVRQLIHLTRQLAPGVPVFARCRYHIHHWLLTSAGAHVVIDEESQVGQRLAEELLEHAF
jgi:CPA2 family monovalent cation:H+ antiporter-2